MVLVAILMVTILQSFTIANGNFLCAPIRSIAQNMRFSIKGFLQQMWPNPLFPDLVIFTEEIFNGKLHFLCSEEKRFQERRKRISVSLNHMLGSRSCGTTHQTYPTLSKAIIQLVIKYNFMQLIFGTLYTPIPSHSEKILRLITKF